MGFWHTGYIEFHEPVGLDGEFKLSPVEFPCAHCGQIYPSPDELRKHRFEAHPLRRPAMFLDGRELGTQRVRITRSLSASDVRVEGGERATLNGAEVAVTGLGRALSRVTSDVCQIRLSKDGVEAAFELEIRIASDRDLAGVEHQFARMARGQRLDMRAVEEFISGASPFTTAIGYCDGICAYLYGLLAKERARDSSLSYEAYGSKFAKAVEELAAYDRNLARTIGSVIEFHFNHFRDSARLCPGSRVAYAAARYADWLDLGHGTKYTKAIPDERAGHLEALVTDWETEQIVRWSTRPLANLSAHVEEIDQFFKRDLAEFDRVKLHVLLAEFHSRADNAKLALEHAKALRNVAAVESWAEALIRSIGEQ